MNEKEAGKINRRAAMGLLFAASMTGGAVAKPDLVERYAVGLAEALRAKYGGEWSVKINPLSVHVVSRALF